MLVSQNYKYICFYYWDKTEHAKNPYQKEYLPVDGFIWAEKTSSTQIKLWYAGQMTIELTHTLDHSNRVINAFKSAFNKVRTGTMPGAEVNFDIPFGKSIGPPPTLPPIYVSNVSVKKIP